MMLDGLSDNVYKYTMISRGRGKAEKTHLSISNDRTCLRQRPH